MKLLSLNFIPLTLAGILCGCTSKKTAQLSPTLTLESPRSPKFRFAFGACNSQTDSQDFWKRIAALDPDLMVTLGDNVYGHYDRIEDVAKAYEQLKAHPEYQEFRSQIPLIATWDDHDYGENDGGGNFKQKKEAKKLFLNFFYPELKPAFENKQGVYGSYLFSQGDKKIQFLLLDTRYSRGPLKKLPKRPRNKGPYIPNFNSQSKMLSEEQWKWFETELQKPADFRVIASSIQVVPGDHGWESWGNLPLERERFLKLLKKHSIHNAIIISGDRHQAAIWKMERENQSPLWEMTSSSLNRPLPQHLWIQKDEEYRQGPIYFQPNFGLIEIDWQNAQAHLQVRASESGALLQDEIVNFR